MTKNEAYGIAQGYGQEASFVANVIYTQHSNAAKKLKGLVELLKAGYSIRTAQFDIDVLVINGRKADWAILQSPNLAKTWGY